MNPAVIHNWYETNQRYLMAALGAVREVLERHVARAEGMGLGGNQPGHAAAQKLSEAHAGLPAPAALETLCATFGLSPFERDLLLLCAGPELDGTFSSLCATAHGDPRRPYPTFGLALAALPESHWSALAPGAPLRRWRLIEARGGEPLASSPLRIEERVLHYLTGVSCLEERLQGLVEPLSAPAKLCASHEALAQRIVEFWSRAGQPSWPIVQLCGIEPAGKRAIAALACAAVGMRLHAIRASDIPIAVAEREALARLWEREATLSGSGLLLEWDELESAEHARPALSFLEGVGGLLLVASREPLRVRNRLTLRLDVGKPTPEEQRALWEKALGLAAQSLNGQVEAVVTQFHLGLSDIYAASAEVLVDQSESVDEALAPRLWAACRAQARPRLDDLAQRIESATTWDDLVLPDPQLQTLREIAIHLRRRTTVYGTWGFAAKGSRGLGISALFAGASGTGKTMAAEVLANELELDLYRIDLSQVVSKYIGETEKNLRRVFEAAEEGGAILLFDEADALFGKRSEVKDSHDRYANIEVSYLLQRMEAYRGVAILTTNMKSALDPAFMRRLRFVVQFPFPDAGQRAQMWRRVFPATTPTEGLDVTKLARLNVAGGTIRNIALNAAFLAAEAGELVRMAHILRAARSEYAKLEKPLTDTEIGGWV